MKTIDNGHRDEDENHDDHRLAEELESLYHHVARIDQPNVPVEKSDDLKPGLKIPEVSPAAARPGLDPVGKTFRTRPRSGARGYSWRSKARRRQKASATKKKAWIVVLMILSLLAGGLAVGFLPPERVKGFSHGLTRLKNTFAFIVLRQKPHFYSLILEKNGKDFHLTSQDVLEVSYGDEFVIKRVSTDVLFGGGVAVSIEGVGEKYDFGKPLRGIDLVDKAVLTGRGVLGGIKPGDFSLRIAYKGEGIASIPVRIQIDRQGWLNYARSSVNQKAQIEYLKRAIAMSPEDASVNKMLASRYFKAGMNREAIARYQELLLLNPDDETVLADLTKCYLKNGQYEEAIRTAAKLLRANPQDEVTLADMALAWGNLGNWKEAIASYHAALKIRPDTPIVIFRLGEAYEKTNQLEKAAQQYRLVLEKVPKADNVVVVLAKVSMKMGNVDEAIRWHREVVKRQPKNAGAYANLGLAYGEKGQVQEEIENYQQAIVLNPRDSIIHFNLGAAHEKKGLFQEALKSYTTAFELNPDLTKAESKIKQMRILIIQQKR